MLWPVNPLRGKTTDWRAVCGKTACTVRREGGPNSIGSPYPYLPVSLSTPCQEIVDLFPFEELDLHVGIVGQPFPTLLSQLVLKRGQLTPPCGKQVTPP